MGEMGISKIKSQKKKAINKVLEELTGTDDMSDELYWPVEEMIKEALEKMPQYKQLSPSQQEDLEEIMYDKTCIWLDKAKVTIDKIYGKYYDN